MKRYAAALLMLSIAIVSVLQFQTVRVAAAGVNDFSIENYQIDYYLGRSADGRSTLKTVETITALFPLTDQNHGLERAIPNNYDGHTTHLAIESITDENGKAYNYSTRLSNDNTVLRIGDADKYVHDRVTYKLTYTQRDVTKYYADTGRDEFYWDTNGTEWKVPILLLSARLHLGDSLGSATTGNNACYQGVAGSTDPCSLMLTEGRYTAETSMLQPLENVSISVGFKAHTFNPYVQSTPDKVLGFVLLGLFVSFLVTTPIGIGLLIWYIYRYYRRSNRTTEITTIIPEYVPPPDTSVSTAAAISNKPERSFSAQLIDFAVRHYIRIYETRQKSFWRSANYELEITKDISDLKAEEQELFRDIFDSTAVGTRLDMSSMKKNYALAAKLADNPAKLRQSIAGSYGLRARDDAQSQWFKRAGVKTLIAAILTLSPALLGAAIAAFISGWMLKPLTDKGLSLARYLKGLEEYIKVAEIDRLRMLQSPEGAIKVGAAVDTNDKRQLIKLYERVLPYAILFGQEKEWNKRLGDYYQTANQSPTWYSGHTAVFNAAVFSSAMSNFNGAATYSNPSSSSSGGSGGGGSSGGGGGGGGGGGW